MNCFAFRWGCKLKNENKIQSTAQCVHAAAYHQENKSRESRERQMELNGASEDECWLRKAAPLHVVGIETR